MCITFFRQRPGSLFPFIIAFNRDENLARTAQPLRFHHTYNNILCGVDVLTGTTWFALNKETGNFTCLTNFRTKFNYTRTDLPFKSRGILVMEYAKIDDPDIPSADKMTIEQWTASLKDGAYKGFNLLYGNVKSGQPLKVFTNTNIPDEKEWVGDKRMQDTKLNEY